MITVEDINRSLRWMVTDIEHRRDNIPIGGGPGNDLQEAIDLLSTLEKMGNGLIINVDSIPAFQSGKLTREDISAIVMDALKLH